MCTYVLKKMLLGATSGEHIGSTFSVIYILLKYFTKIILRKLRLMTIHEFSEQTQLADLT